MSASEVSRSINKIYRSQLAHASQDIDGDGRLDYCVIHENRDLECWRNGGLSNTGVEYWNEMGIVFSAAGRGLDNRNIEEMRLGKSRPGWSSASEKAGIGDKANSRTVDINGDWRSDMLWVNGNGQVTTWINQRGDGVGMAPYWREAGVTHPGRPYDVGGQDSIIFGRLSNDFSTDVR